MFVAKSGIAPPRPHSSKIWYFRYEEPRNGSERHPQHAETVWRSFIMCSPVVNTYSGYPIPLDIRFLKNGGGGGGQSPDFATNIGMDRSGCPTPHWHSRAWGAHCRARQALVVFFWCYWASRMSCMTRNYINQSFDLWLQQNIGFAFRWCLEWAKRCFWPGKPGFWYSPRRQSYSTHERGTIPKS